MKGLLFVLVTAATASEEPRRGWPVCCSSTPPSEPVRVANPKPTLPTIPTSTPQLSEDMSTEYGSESAGTLSRHVSDMSQASVPTDQVMQPITQRSQSLPEGSVSPLDTDDPGPPPILGGRPHSFGGLGHTEVQRAAASVQNKAPLMLPIGALGGRSAPMGQGRTSCKVVLQHASTWPIAEDSQRSSPAGTPPPASSSQENLRSRTQSGPLPDGSVARNPRLLKAVSFRDGQVTPGGTRQDLCSPIRTYPEVGTDSSGDGSTRVDAGGQTGRHASQNERGVAFGDAFRSRFGILDKSPEGSPKSSSAGSADSPPRPSGAGSAAFGSLDHNEVTFTLRMEHDVEPSGVERTGAVEDDEAPCVERSPMLDEDSPLAPRRHHNQRECSVM